MRFTISGKNIGFGGLERHASSAKGEGELLTVRQTLHTLWTGSVRRGMVKRGRASGAAYRFMKLRMMF